MDYFGYAYFVERPRRIDDLMVPHLNEQERLYRIVTEIQLPAIDYENFMDVLDAKQFLDGLAPHGASGLKFDLVLSHQNPPLVSPRTGRVGRPLQQCEHCPFFYELNWQRDMKTRNQNRHFWRY